MTHYNVQPNLIHLDNINPTGIVNNHTKQHQISVIEYISNVINFIYINIIKDNIFTTFILILSIISLYIRYVTYDKHERIEQMKNTIIDDEQITINNTTSEIRKQILLNKLSKLNKPYQSL
jgi:hypothetical protein